MAPSARPGPGGDPYAALGLTPGASDDDLRHAYRRLVMIHHPDHNGGSPESAVRFAEVQEAYAHVRLLRRTAARPAAGSGDAAVEARIAEMEQELGRARAERERAARRAERIARLRRPARPDRPAPRPSDEELGYVSTRDSFSKILDDALEERRPARAQPGPSPSPSPAPKPRSIGDWIDELSDRLTGEDPSND